jgi:hypothetical protein
MSDTPNVQSILKSLVGHAGPSLSMARHETNEGLRKTKSTNNTAGPSNWKGKKNTKVCMPSVENLLHVESDIGCSIKSKALQNWFHYCLD